MIPGLAAYAALRLPTGVTDAVAAQGCRLQSGSVSTFDTCWLHLDALRDLKRVNSHLIEGAAYPVLSAKGALLPTRLPYAAQRT